MKYSLLFILSLLLGTALTTKAQQEVSETQIDDEFFIPVEQSKLYARLIGHADKPIIITLHGGPGAFSVDHEFYKDVFEQDYLVLYFDQRGGGKSDECKDKSMLTTDQFVKDLDDVVDFIKARYPNQKVNLLGTSWGGTYGFLYLLKHQEKINSFISSSGFVDSPQRNLSLISHERKLAQKGLKSQKDPLKRKRYQEILTQLDRIERSGFMDFFQDMNLLRYEFPKDLGFDVYWAQPALQAKKTALLSDTAFYTRVKYSPSEIEKAFEKLEYVNEVFMNTASYNNLNIVSQLALIKRPVLVIQGEFDYAIGVDQGRTIYNALTHVPKADKSLVYLKNASHNTAFEAPEAYYKAMKLFFDKHN